MRALGGVGDGGLTVFLITNLDYSNSSPHILLVYKLTLRVSRECVWLCVVFAIFNDAA